MFRVEKRSGKGNANNNIIEDDVEATVEIHSSIPDFQLVFIIVATATVFILRIITVLLCIFRTTSLSIISAILGTYGLTSFRLGRRPQKVTTRDNGDERKVLGVLGSYNVVEATNPGHTGHSNWDSKEIFSTHTHTAKRMLTDCIGPLNCGPHMLCTTRKPGDVLMDKVLGSSDYTTTTGCGPNLR